MKKGIPAMKKILSWANELPTKLFFAAILFAMVFFNQNNCLASSWIRSLGGPASEDGIDVERHRDGGYVALGNRYHDLYDTIVIKVDPNGNKKWQKIIASDVNQYLLCSSMAATRDGGFIIGGRLNVYDESDDYIVYNCLIKIDSNGSQKWRRYFLSADDPDLGDYEFISDVKVSHDGGFICAGYSGWTDVAGGTATVIKTDASGNKKWVKYYYSPDAHEFGAGSIQLTPDGGYTIAGSAGMVDSNGIPTEEYMPYIIKIDAVGNVQWQKIYKGGSKGSSAHCIQRTPSDNGYIVAAGKDLVKIDSKGNLKWRKTRPRLTAESLLVANDGGFIITGHTLPADPNAQPYETEIYLLKTDKNGNEKWRRYFGKTTDSAESVKKTSDGGFIVVGSDSNNGGNISLIKTNRYGKVAP
jgi:hypothetical protein